jgi:hypothetical protein
MKPWDRHEGGPNHAARELLPCVALASRFTGLDKGRYTWQAQTRHRWADSLHLLRPGLLGTRLLGFHLCATHFTLVLEAERQSQPGQQEAQCVAEFPSQACHGCEPKCPPAQDSHTGEGTCT